MKRGKLLAFTHAYRKSDKSTYGVLTIKQILVHLNFRLSLPADLRLCWRALVWPAIYWHPLFNTLRRRDHSGLGLEHTGHPPGIWGHCPSVAGTVLFSLNLSCSCVMQPGPSRLSLPSLNSLAVELHWMVACHYFHSLILGWVCGGR